MQKCYRWFSAVIVAGVCAISSATVSSNAAPQDASWQTGDILVGVGWREWHPGQYWVFDAQGNRKQVGGVDQVVQDQWPTHEDAWGATTTGCMLAPDGTALYTTSLSARTISQFFNSASNGAQVTGTMVVGGTDPNPLDIATAYNVAWLGATDLRPWRLFAIETIVFDKLGDYYVGGQGEWLGSSNDTFGSNGLWNRPSWILKFSGVTHQVTGGPWEVPSGENGVDHLDIGTDDPATPVLYYTSEDTVIRIFRPWKTAPDNPLDNTDRFGAIQVYDDTPSNVLAGTLYALRALPPLVPGGEPSGFLIASSSDVLRVDASGDIIKRYSADGIGGERFALNITPDGGSFWTATYPNDQEEWYPHLPLTITVGNKEIPNPDLDPGQRGFPNAVGWLIQYHIASGAELKRVRIDAGAVWGLCIQHEYTAGMNTCYDLDAFGNPIDSDGDGQVGDVKECEIPANCIDTGSTTGECKVPGLPDLTAQVSDTWNYAGDAVAGYPNPSRAPIATSPLGHQLIYSVSYGANGPVNGIQFDAANGNFYGTVAQYANATTHTVTITVTDALDPRLSLSRTFKWEVRLRSGNQAPRFTTLMGHSLFGDPPVLYGSTPELGGVNFQVAELAPHYITYTVRDDEFDSLWVAATYQVLDRAQFALGNIVAKANTSPVAGLPPGYVLANHIGQYQHLPLPGGAMSATPCTGCVPVRSQGQGEPEIGVPPGYAVVGVIEPVKAIFAAASAAPENLYLVSIAITDNPRDGSGWQTSGDPLDLARAKEEHAWLRDESARSFVLDVVNHTPVFAPSSDGGANPPNQSTKVGSNVNYFVGATDSDGPIHPPLTYEFSGLPAGLTWNSNGIVSGIAGLPIGSLDFTSTVTVKITDAAGKSRIGTFTWHVYTNNVPDCNGARPTQSLWPPNHKMVEIGILGVTDADGDQLTITIGPIWQDEQVATKGAGHTVLRDAWPGVNGDTAWVRAERTGLTATPGDGRVYRIFFTAADATDSCTGSVLVGVPHDQGGMKMPVPNASWWDSQTRLPVPGPIPPLPSNYPY